MKLKTGVDRYPLKNFGQMKTLAVSTTDGFFRALRYLSPADFLSLRGHPSKDPVGGIPVYFTVMGEAPHLHLYPLPDRAYHVIGTYYPAVRAL